MGIDVQYPFKSYTNEELYGFVEELRNDDVEKDSELRKISIKVYGRYDGWSNAILEGRLMIELADRLKEANKKLKAYGN